MEDVARRASVSSATVSRVLNGRHNVGIAYRRRVLEAVEELGYRPNRLAKNLRLQRTAAVGIVVPDIENPHFSGMVRAVEDRAYRQGYRVLVCNTDESPEKQRAYLEMLTEERVLGVILSVSDPNDPGISTLLDLGIPLVAFDREVADPRADAVLADNVSGARMAVDLLAGAGHRRIAFVSGRRDVETGAERLDGYELTMRARGLEPDVVGGSFRTEEARVAVADLLSGRERPSALVVGNNLMTLGALHAIREHNLAVPGDVAIVAFDDPTWAALVDPPLTTLAQPVQRMASEAMGFLLQRIAAARTEPHRTVHPFTLRVRESCGTGRRGI